jgi:hypothetical protein
MRFLSFHVVSNSVTASHVRDCIQSDHANGGNMSEHVPAFTELEDQLQHDGIEADPTSIASVILSLATANDWTKRPKAVGE